MSDAMQLLLPVLFLVILAIASLRFGADSRKLGKHRELV